MIKMKNITFKVSEKSKEQIDDILLDKYHNYLTKVGNDKNVEYVESTDEEGHLLNLFVVAPNAGRVILKNSFYLDVDSTELNLFLLFCQDRYQASSVKVGGLLDTLPETSLPSITYTDNVDNIADLPATFAEYINRLGKQTKKHAKYYLGRIAKNFPEMQFTICEGDKLSREDYLAIANLSKERMASKYVEYGPSEKDDLQRFEELGRKGIIFTATIDGRIRAGCVGFLIGSDFYLSKIAHDNQYSKYNLGQVTLLKLIEWLIGREVTRFHFLWCKGVDYKTRFGGVEHEMHYTLYYRKKNIDYLKTKLSIKSRLILENAKNVVRKNHKFIKFLHKLKYSSKHAAPQQ